MSLRILTNEDDLLRSRKRRSRFLRYYSERDVPVSSNGKKTKFRYEFELNNAERTELHTQTGINLTTNLIVEIIIEPNNEWNPEVKFRKQGSGAVKLNKHRHQIADFIEQRLQLQYISTIRSTEDCMENVELLIERELLQLELDPKYKKAIETITKQQKKLLDNVSGMLTATLQKFIPKVDAVKISSEDSIRRSLRRSSSIWINDGENTLLDMKGSGVQSLTTISVAYHFTKTNIVNDSLVLIVDEPESHLHPDAIYHLREVLKEISADHQVIIATHSPLLVDRFTLKNNIIVNDHKAHSARNIKEIREILGTRLSDNLINAQGVVLVEGENDKKLLMSWLSKVSNKIAKAIDGGQLIFHSLGTVSALGYQSSIWKSNLCKIYAIIDNDAASNRALADGVAAKQLDHTEYRMIEKNASLECELEDMIDSKIYKSILQSRYGVDLDRPAFLSSLKKWSDRVKDSFESQGKAFNDATKAELKFLVTNLAETTQDSLDSRRRAEIVNWVSDIEKLL